MPLDCGTLWRSHDWALLFFGDHQIAVVRHDDNACGIVHAHVIVNNTNLKTGNRVQTRNPLELNRTLQEMARVRGLHGLSNEAQEKSSGERPAAREGARKAPSKRQEIHVSRAEREIVAEGGYSWVSDIRSRVSIAKGLSGSEAEFRRVLDLLGIGLADASSRGGRRARGIRAASRKGRGFQAPGRRRSPNRGPRPRRPLEGRGARAAMPPRTAPRRSGRALDEDRDGVSERQARRVRHDVVYGLDPSGKGERAHELRAAL